MTPGTPPPPDHGTPVDRPGPAGSAVGTARQLTHSVDGVFDPAGITWTAVSVALGRMRRTVLLARVLALVLAVLVAAVLTGWWLLLLAWLVPAVDGVAEWIVIGRQVRAWGYAERADDLLIRHGVMFRELVVVPYGRMQFVDVKAGPLERAFDIAQVQLHTASAGTDARIPGLSAAEAGRLRDRLASRGQARLAGL
jgi:membrane protein YdbS with pleckstrin-like domain